jgi:DNA-binding NarL/FixJ family response regulator
MTFYQPIFVPRQALRILAVRRLLADTGIGGDAQVVYPEDLERIMAGARNCLVIVDGRAMPHPDVFARMRRYSPGSRFVVWTEEPTTDLLVTTIECGLNGLLSSSLPPREASYALLRICRGERLLRFDAATGATKPTHPNRLAAAPAFDAQWMLQGAEPPGRET